MVAGQAMRKSQRSVFVCALSVVVGVGIMLAPSAQAQIYMCTKDDGTRIYSDERCGPDAKVVQGITSKKRPAAGASSNRPARVPKTHAELDLLIEQCNAGDMRACREWTHGGGPAYLKEQERRAGVECDGGSLAACERRYCTDGMTQECRTRVLAASKLAGDDWYLREQRTHEAGGIAYDLRCATTSEGRAVRDFSVICVGPAGPARCALSSGQSFARFDQAAASYCSK